MIVKLTHLDKQNSVSYDDIVDVHLAVNKEYVRIGTCSVFKDKSGLYYGNLKLKKEVSGELFFYYRERPNNEGIYWFNGLDFYEKEQPDHPTTQLKEMIV